MTSKPRKSLRRVNGETLADVAPVEDVSGLIDFTNTKQWESIKDAVALLFYKETSDDVIFDPEGDASLLRMHARPFAFSNSKSLLAFEALTSRARYYCKPHPSGEEVAAQVASALGIGADELLIFVYKRDTARDSTVKQRHRSPFTNTVNGIGTAGSPVVLFNQFSHDPFAAMQVVWQREMKLNASVGILALRLVEQYG